MGGPENTACEYNSVSLEDSTPVSGLRRLKPCQNHLYHYLCHHDDEDHDHDHHSFYSAAAASPIIDTLLNCSCSANSINSKT